MRNVGASILFVLLTLTMGSANARWLSVDPVQADPNTGQNFNRYWYANNNPYKFTDPDGRQSFPKMFVPINPQAVQAQAVARDATKQAEAHSMDGVKAVGQSLAEGRGTVQVGVVVNGAVGPVAATVGAGVAVDGQGNVAGYAEYGAGVGPPTAANAVAGISVSGTNANTVNDLAGPAENLSVGGGDGVAASADVGAFQSGGNTFTSVGVTVGAGAGAGGSTTTTNTQIVPIIENKKQ